MDFYHQICLSHTDFIYSVSVVQYLTSIIVVGRINIYLFLFIFINATVYVWFLGQKYVKKT